MFKIFGDQYYEVTYKSFKFSGGEVQVKLDPLLGFTGNVLPSLSTARIKANIFSSDDLMELLLVVDALRRRYNGIKLSLICPYLPYARQDRVCGKGEALALKVCCDIINSLEFEQVEVWDVHSDVALALLNKATNIEQHNIYPSVSSKLDKEPILVSPDAGAAKKVYATAQKFGLEVILAGKNRNPENGEITGTYVNYYDTTDKDLLIMDDICDGGRTFIELSKVLRPHTTGKIMLYVTHGIFSKGITPVLSVFDKVFVANMFPQAYTLHDKNLVVL